MGFSNVGDFDEEKWRKHRRELQRLQFIAERLEVSLDHKQKAQDAVRSEKSETRRPPAVADEGFIRTNQGRAVACIENLEHALKLLEVRLHFCEMRGEARIQIGDKPEGALNDEAVQDMKLLMEERFGMLFGKQYFGDTLFTIAREDRRHPVREYLSSLMWDDVPRIDRWLTTHLGVQESDYTNEVGRCFLMAAVARVIQPGCQFQNMLILESTPRDELLVCHAIEELVPVYSWHEGFHKLHKSPTRRQLSLWIVNVSEECLTTKRGYEATRIQLSRENDRIRHGKNLKDYPRQSVCVCIAESHVFLQEYNYWRFWPVKVGAVDENKVKADRDQLWAEAVHRFKAGEAWTMRQELWAAAAVEQTKRIRKHLS